jgi:hypothetical protein
MKTKVLGSKIKGKIEFLGDEKETWGWKEKSSRECMRNNKAAKSKPIEEMFNP